MKPYILTCLVLIALSIIFILGFDRQVSYYFYNHQFFISFFKFITNVGSFEWVFLSILIFILASFWFESLRKYIFVICVSVVMADAIVIALKYICGQARPVLFFRENIYGFYPFIFKHNYDSMPSGHTTINATLAFSVFLKNKKVGLIFIVWSILVGLSRIILLKHYVSNVLISFAISIIVALFVFSLEKRIKR